MSELSEFGRPFQVTVNEMTFVKFSLRNTSIYRICKLGTAIFSILRPKFAILLILVKMLFPDVANLALLA